MKNRLDVPEDRKLVLVTLGGIQEKLPSLDMLLTRDDIDFIIPGSNRTMERQRNILLLPQHSDFFHPDLVNASDAVIGKVGYSTLAEVYHAGTPFGYISRNTFRESMNLLLFIEKHIQGMPVEEDGFLKGQWSSILPKLLELPRIARNGINGAEQAAAFIYNILPRS